MLCQLKDNVTLVLNFRWQDSDFYKFTESEKKTLSKNLADLKTEMSIDTKQLSEQNKIKTLLVTKSILEKKQQQLQNENRSLEVMLQEEQRNSSQALSEIDILKDAIKQLDATERKSTDEK